VDTVQARHALPHDVLEVAGQHLTLVEVITRTDLILLDFGDWGLIVPADAVLPAVDLGPRICIEEVVPRPVYEPPVLRDLERTPELDALFADVHLDIPRCSRLV
jgi:hypothetical protein